MNQNEQLQRIKAALAVLLHAMEHDMVDPMEHSRRLREILAA